MAKKILLFAAIAFNLAETTRLIEIAKGIINHPGAAKVFDVQFISDGGNFEYLIEDEGFLLKRMEPRLTDKKIKHLTEIKQREKLAPAFSLKEMIIRVKNEIEYLKILKPVAVISCSYMSIPITCRLLKIPFVGVIQSTRLKEFFANGAGMTDNIKLKSVKVVIDWLILLFSNMWFRVTFLNPVNKAARYFGVKEYQNIFEYWRGEITLVAEPAEFSEAKLPSGYYYIGPLIARQQSFLIPDEIIKIPSDKPLIYFTMGSSGNPKIIAKIIESFTGKPYLVLAPVKFQLAKVPKVNIPANVIITDWLPAHLINKIADLSVNHGGIGTLLTAASAGKPVIGIGMKPEQITNITHLVRKGFAIVIPKSKDLTCKIQAAIQLLLEDKEALYKAELFSKIIEKWNGPQLAAELLYEKFGMATAKY